MIHGLGRPLLHPRLKHAVAILNRLEERSYRQLRPPCLPARQGCEFFERHRFKHEMARHTFKFKGMDEPLWRHDLTIHAVERVLVAG